MRAILVVCTQSKKIFIICIVVKQQLYCGLIIRFYNGTNYLIVNILIISREEFVSQKKIMLKICIFLLDFSTSYNINPYLMSVLGNY